MNRERLTPREGWKQKLEEVGFTFHSIDGVYWDESVCYSMLSSEIDALEKASQELHGMCLQAVEHILAKDLFERLVVPMPFRQWIRDSWVRKDPSIYGRFDFTVQPGKPPKLLEYNADTPTSLVESSIAQWFWLEEAKPGADQFNSIHEKLIERWAEFKGPLSAGVHFASVHESEEDFRTVEYLRDTALQAGIEGLWVAVEDLGWSDGLGRFVDLEEKPIENLFKLYPWEWFLREAFGVHLVKDPARFLEPPWKMLLSNKGLLPILWELFPNHPNLLPAFFSPEPLGPRHARKPLYSREGANVTLVDGIQQTEVEGPYGKEGYIYQALAPLPVFDGEHHAVVGSWIVGDQSAGIGIREDSTAVTRNTSRFVPHYFQH